MATTRKKKEQTYELRYTGCLTGAPTIYLHYGTENWSDVSEVKMRKLKSCYKTEITVPATVDINFCFRDANGNWDNNYGNDYSYCPKTSSVEEYSTITVTPCIDKEQFDT